MSAPARRAIRGGGFSLIEMLAVVAIFALIAGLVLPNLGVLRSRALREAARRLSAQLELARQRTIVTSRPHQVVLDLEQGRFHLEAMAAEAEEAPAEPPEIPGSPPRISLSPPRRSAGAFEPLPGVLGRAIRLGEGIAFGGVETENGWTDGGETTLRFERDGTTTYAQIVIEDDGGRSLILEVLPLADAVRILDEPL